MASVVGICNSALSKIGAKTIQSLTEGTQNAAICAGMYETARDRALRSHPWAFAATRAQLAAAVDAPAFGPAHAYPLPADFVRLLRPDESDNVNTLRRTIEGGQILTDETAPLDIRYVRLVTDPNEMDALFREVVAVELALDIVEPITQSNAKRNALVGLYDMMIREARKANAFEAPPANPPDDTWLTARL